MQAFHAAYDAVLASRWPADTDHTTVPTPYGPTRVNGCGPRHAPPVVLLPGGGSATSTAWFATASVLGRTHRVHAVDLAGAPGRGASPGGAPPVRTVADLMAWLDAVLDALDIDDTALCGHSYGGWISLHYALRSPRRVRRLVLLDPTNTFVPFSPRYLLRALPLLLRPTPARSRSFLRWETGGAPLDDSWLALQAHGAGLPAARPVTGPRPGPAELRALRTPTLLLLAGRSRAHDVRAAAAAARQVPAIRTEILPDATHHTLPTASPPGTDDRIAAFLRQ
ncbi:alpha/beta fold hydrolase [Streptomyces glaucosporus]|uniref:Alpha/beta fold hydrolase n=2 Tax=Streptomyces glaucosporus TaxID=284044 RepID=A0ABN3IL80_9ACTN